MLPLSVDATSSFDCSFPFLNCFLPLFPRPDSVDGLCCRLTQPCPRTYTPPVQFRDLEVNRKSIQLVKKLGHGSFGEVHLAVRNKNYQVAVKVLLNNVNSQNAMDRNKFLDEAKVMHKLRHPRIVTLLGVCTEPPEEPVFIIVEYMQKGALSDFLHRPEGQKLVFADLIGIISQVCVCSFSHCFIYCSAVCFSL
ncbi:unnamed protein product [Dibothriocephalus latus]|uniref:Protein kinase domain-containing protein n=1 Tax=Dibothriocephalus latus TaxID=60516 RepID=A0A3P7REL4_DIBLA|nr:unnamed protein product [Dibothriocephalus latus]